MHFTHAMHTDPVGDTPATRPDVSLFDLLGSLARGASRRTLAGIALGAGALALGTAATGIATWWLLALCYLAWSFALWGLVFAPTHPHTRAWRGVELALIGSDVLVAAVVGIALFYLLLGPRWML